MIRLALGVATLGSVALVAWHHAGWPLVLRAATRRSPAGAPAIPADDALPRFAVVMPAHDEAATVAAKVRNLAALDYPADRLRVVIACDGCSDGTAETALAALREPACRHLVAEVHDHATNRGKLAVLDATLPGVDGELVALTDVSALLPRDALRRMAAHYADPRVGAVGGGYALRPDATAGEATYWRYQSAIKRGEAAIGAPMGMHGAFWTFRHAAWNPVPTDTINDDFAMPMDMLRRGWSLRYDPGVAAIEGDASPDPAAEARRRRRIAAGNAQQLVRNAWLLSPARGGAALAFASGKALRVLCPFLMAGAGAGAVLLAPGSAFFAGMAACGLLAIAGAAAGAAMGNDAPRPLAVLRYILCGHLASMAGAARYAAGLDRAPWKRATPSKGTPI